MARTNTLTQEIVGTMIEWLAAYHHSTTFDEQMNDLFHNHPAVESLKEKEDNDWLSFCNLPEYQKAYEIVQNILHRELTKNEARHRGAKED